MIGNTLFFINRKKNREIERGGKLHDRTLKYNQGFNSILPYI